MKTVRRLFYVDIVKAIAFVAAAFLSLSFFIDVVDQMNDVGKNGYTLVAGLLYSLLLQPGHVYEVAPIAVLIGTIYTLAQMAQASEYTILRTGGLGPWRALWLLAALGLGFGALTFLVGDYLAPLGARSAQDVQAMASGGLRLNGSGAWLKDHAMTAEGERSYSINVRTAGPGARLSGIRIFEFDADNRLVAQIAAKSAVVQPDQLWRLKDVQITRWPAELGEGAGAGPNGRPIAGGATAQPAAAAAVPSTAPSTRSATLSELDWRSTLTAGVVAAAVSPVASMSTVQLAGYIAHLAENEQAAQVERITFWKRALYPFACVVMVALALPFAYLHARAGGVALKVFGGIMLGISFVLLNNVAGHLGLLHAWTPWIVAATPSAIYLLMSLAAFSWLVRYR